MQEQLARAQATIKTLHDQAAESKSADEQRAKLDAQRLVKLQAELSKAKADNADAQKADVIEDKANKDEHTTKYGVPAPLFSKKIGAWYIPSEDDPDRPLFGTIDGRGLPEPCTRTMYSRSRHSRLIFAPS